MVSISNRNTCGAQNYMEKKILVYIKKLKLHARNLGSVNIVGKTGGVQLAELNQ